MRTSVSENEIVERMAEGLRPHYAEMREAVASFGPEVEVAATTENITFRAPQVFAEIHPKKASLRVLVRPDNLAISEGETQPVYGVDVRRVPDSHRWHVNYWFEVDEDTPIDAISQLLRDSYVAVKRAASA